MATGKQKSKTETAGFLGFSPDGTQVIGLATGMIKRIDVPTGRELSALTREGSFAGYDPNGKDFVVNVSGVIQVHDAKTGDLVRAFRVDRFGGGLGLFTYSADRKKMAYGNLKTVTLRQFETGEELFILKLDQRATALSFSPSGKSIASASTDNAIRIWNTHNGEFVKKIPVRWLPTNIAYSPDGRWLAVGYGGNFDDVSILDANTGDEILALKRAVRANADTHAVTFNSQGTLLAAATWSFVQVWEISTPKKAP